jgi:hypothetical protein
MKRGVNKGKEWCSYTYRIVLPIVFLIAKAKSRYLFQAPKRLARTQSPMIRTFHMLCYAMPDLMIHILELSPFFSRKKSGRHIKSKIISPPSAPPSSLHSTS